MQRTIRIQLQPDIETAQALSQTIEQYTWSFNTVCQLGWEKKLTSGVELHKATYYDHRAIFSPAFYIFLPFHISDTPSYVSSLSA